VLRGRPHLVNLGRMAFGDQFFLSSQPVQSHLVAMRGALIDIGDRVSISYGAALSAQAAIRVGSDTIIGPFAVIVDSDFHRPGNRDAAGDVAPIRIGAGVIIGARVTILRSADIGDGARILAGSMVSGVVAAGATVGGVPARVIGDAAFADSIDVPELIRSVLGLGERPGSTAGPKDIPEWDSLGTLRLLLAIEDAYGITVREEEVQAAKTVAALSAIVEIARARAATPEG